MKSHSKSKTTIKRDAEAKVRLIARNGRTDEQQLSLLEERGAGDCDEARRIKARIFKAQNPTDEDKQVPVKKSRPARKRRAVPASLM